MTWPITRCLTGNLSINLATRVLNFETVNGGLGFDTDRLRFGQRLQRYKLERRLSNFDYPRIDDRFYQL